MVAEVGGGVDHAEELHDALHPVQIAARRSPHLGDQVEGADLRRRLPVLDRRIGAKLAFQKLRPGVRDLTGDEHEVAGLHRRHIIRRRGGRVGEFEAKLRKAGVDLSGHVRSPLPVDSVAPTMTADAAEEKGRGRRF